MRFGWVTVVDMPILALAALGAGMGCGAGVPAPPLVKGPVGAPSAEIPRDAGAPIRREAPAREGHSSLAEPTPVALPFSIEPSQSGASILFVSQFADDRASYVRRLDPTSGILGPTIRLVDQHVFGAFDFSDGSWTLATTNGTELCLTPSSHPARAFCAAIAPRSVVAVGDRLALLEVVTERSSSSSVRPQPEKKASQPPKRNARNHPPHAPSDKRKQKRRGSAGRHQAAAHPVVDVLIRWASKDGEIEAEARPSGLRFESPLAGMNLLDAVPHAPGAEVFWFETAAGTKSTSPLGRGRIMAGELRADGSLDLASRVAVVEADLDYGALHNHGSPRVFARGPSVVYVDVGPKGQCEAVRVLPTLTQLKPSQAACLIAPDRLGAVAPDALTVRFEELLAEHPRRTFGQSKTDIGLVAWGGDRAYWLRGPALRSASSDGALREEPPPFTATRSRIAWGSIALDGEGVAWVDGEIVHRGAALTRAKVAQEAAAAVFGELAGATGRTGAIRVGSTWWTGRGQLLQVWPSPGATPPEARPPAKTTTEWILRTSPDASVRVGGRLQGISLEIDKGALVVSSLNEEGRMDRLHVIDPSPVRVGFDACDRAGGGAIVAGASARDPSAMVAFTVSERGLPSAPRPLSLGTRSGELRLRATALPAGGAQITDTDRTMVAWLDDDARVTAVKPWTGGSNGTACLDGRPAPLTVPSPEAGSFLPVPDVRDGDCLVSETVWGTDGGLRWFGSRTEGLNASTEFVAFTAAKTGVPTATFLRTGAGSQGLVGDTSATPSGKAPPTPTPGLTGRRGCPAEMVLVAQTYCVDRFEAILVDSRRGEAVSPDYPATPNLLDFALGEWATARHFVGNVHARAFPLPWLDPARIGDTPVPIAVSRLGVRPNGYVSGLVAEGACQAAGKRLCTLDEFVTACRGEADTLFPYGDTYQDGACNVHREEHPAALLHDNASVGHLDPRLNRTKSKGQPLLARTGEFPACLSQWGSDAIYDMVGNLDEWVSQGEGAFAGGFYSRATRSGCETLVDVHPKKYLDYSTGIRCCKDVELLPPTGPGMKLRP